LRHTSATFYPVAASMVYPLLDITMRIHPEASATFGSFASPSELRRHIAEKISSVGDRRGSRPDSYIEMAQTGL